MKQELISSCLVAADLIHRYPKRITAAIAVMLLGGASGSWAVASLSPNLTSEPIRLVTESLITDDLKAQVDLLDSYSFTLYRSEPVRRLDSPERLLQRLGIADPAAAAFLRSNAQTQKALFGRDSAGRTVTAEANERQNLERLKTHWLEADNDTEFKRLVLERTDSGFDVRVETAPLRTTRHIVSGSIQANFLAAVKDAKVPSAVAAQLMTIFKPKVDFQRGLRRGDTFSAIYETLDADGEALLTGRVLSAEFINHGQSHQAMWFESGEKGQGEYYDFAGTSLLKHKKEVAGYLQKPVNFTRISSPFGHRKHPLHGVGAFHSGVDLAATTGTSVKTVAEGKVTFAGTQRGYGNVIYISHNNKDSTVYAHLSRINVTQNQTVKQGQKIGEVGSTGWATGPHLHFEFREHDKPIDPLTAVNMNAAKVVEEVATLAGNQKEAFDQLTAKAKPQLANLRQSEVIERFSQFE